MLVILLNVLFTSVPFCVVKAHRWIAQSPSGPANGQMVLLRQIGHRVYRSGFYTSCCKRISTTSPWQPHIQMYMHSLRVSFIHPVSLCFHFPLRASNCSAQTVANWFLSVPPATCTISAPAAVPCQLRNGHSLVSDKWKHTSCWLIRSLLSQLTD